MKHQGALNNLFQLFLLGGIVVACSSAVDFSARSAQVLHADGSSRSENASGEPNVQKGPEESAAQISTPQAASTEPPQEATSTTPVSSGEKTPESKPILIEKQEYSTSPTDIELPIIKDMIPPPSPDQGNQGNQGNQSSENTEADPPIPITGGFLTCTKANGLYCAIDVQVGQKFAFTSAPKVQISIEINNAPTLIAVTETYQPATSRWHWKLERPGLEISQVTKVVVVLGTGPTATVYQTTFLLTPQRIGDGTNEGTQGGCSLLTFLTSVYGGLTFNKPFVLSQPKQNLQVTIVRLCGIVRAKDGLVKLFKEKEIVGSEFLPKTVGENDFSVQFKDLPPGNYQVQLVPGDDSDIDDFMFYDLRLSY